jgi:hypothetical protein
LNPGSIEAGPPALSLMSPNPEGFRKALNTGNLVSGNYLHRKLNFREDPFSATRE